MHTLALADMGLTYRHTSVSAGLDLHRGAFRARPARPAKILAEMNEVAEYREANQPIKERTGGSTFKNPPGSSAWKLIDAAGCRGLRVGGAKVSDDALQFPDQRSQRLGARTSSVWARPCGPACKKTSGVTLQWEIIRLGEPARGRPTGEALAEALVQ